LPGGWGNTRASGKRPPLPPRPPRPSGSWTAWAATPGACACSCVARGTRCLRSCLQARLNPIP